jgi:hypothetical protein
VEVFALKPWAIVVGILFFATLKGLRPRSWNRKPVATLSELRRVSSRILIPRVSKQTLGWN